MKDEQHLLNDLSEIRSMMERSTKFISLSGLAGVMAGIYALAGVWVLYSYLGFNPRTVIILIPESGFSISDFNNVILLAVLILLLSIGTAFLFSNNKAKKLGEKSWNATSRRMLGSMSIPLIAGGILIILLISKDALGLAIPLSLVFYGIALYNASKYSFDDVKYLGILNICLGLISVWMIEYSLIIWALGFGVLHIIYGLYMHIKYERQVG